MENEAVETVVWEGHPSQWVNLGHFLLCVTVLWIPVAILKYLRVRTTLFRLTTERLAFHRGILSRTEEEVELFRIKDTRLEQPFFLRLVGLGNVHIVSSDVASPNLVLPAIADARGVREKLRGLTEARRAFKGVREVDYT